VPVFAADFIEQNKITGPLFNLYNEGGYLIWRLWPKERVFIDGRSEVYPREVLDELSIITMTYPGWRELVDDKYKINYFILPYRGPVEDLYGGLLTGLIKNNWPMIYWDDSSLIFIRPIPANAKLIEQYGLRHISPLRPPESIPPEEAIPAAKEIESLLQRSPQSQIIKDYAAAFLRSHGGEELLLRR